MVIVAGRGHYGMIKILLQAGSAVQATAVYKAVLAQHPRAVEVLLMDPNASYMVKEEGTMLLQLALRTGSHATIVKLVKAGVDFHRGPTRERLSLIESEQVNVSTTSMGDRDCPEASDDLDSQHARMQSLTTDPPLYVAASLGQAVNVDYLLQAGADVNAAGAKGTALGAALFEGRIDCVAALLSSSEHVHYDNCSLRRNALELAFACGAFAIPAMLLDHCRAMNSLECNHREWALITSVVAENHPMFSLAIASNVNINAATDDGGETALHKAVSQPQTYLPVFLPVHETILNQLLDAGADLFVKGNAGCTPLDRAVDARNLRAISLLLAAGARRGCMGLHALFLNKQNSPEAEIAIIIMFLSHDVDVNVLDFEGHNPLYRAIQQGRNEVVDKLLSLSARPTCLALHAALGASVGTEVSLQLVRRQLRLVQMSMSETTGHVPLHCISQPGKVARMLSKSY
ncbi:hypothetical protein B0A55_08457 [Friedmanniomyces simplex]|uniref:Uncharacterized protein n=1 Tax=Friedmanniomyces simplex TaxID=329884 RepID=A0A4U0WW32_9PEZI|nr:hypothetical protein B0A55_08457 [Friedmanniomyces simplex]